jgi:hypothetical protein
VRIKLVQAALLLVITISTSAAGQQDAHDLHFRLFKGDKTCVCINTRDHTRTVSATEKRVGKSIYQVFWFHTEPRRQVFRVSIGRVSGSDVVKWWNYGIADEADFNGDGVPDYSWYGGDDTGFEMYLFLSTGREYRKVDLLKTLRTAWKKRFHKPAPDFGEVGGRYGLKSTVLERSPSGLIFLTEVEHSSLDEKRSSTYRFRIAEADFE